MKELEHGYRVTVKFNDGTETMIYEYSSEKVADSVVRHYSRSSFIASVEKEDF